MRKGTYVGLLLCMVLLCSLAVSACSKTRNETGTETTEMISADTEEPESTAYQQPSGLYVIVAVDTQEQSIRFWNLELERQQTYNYSGSTYVFDSYGGNMSISQLEPGELVSISLQTGKYILSAVKESSDSWELDDVANFQINTEEADQSYIQIGSSKYKFSSNLLVFSGGVQTTLDQISSSDVLTVRGHDNQVDSISINSGHGTLIVQGTDNYVGGWYCIGNKASGPVTEGEMRLDVTEGTYRFSVANSGYGGSCEITITSGGETVINLEDFGNGGSNSCELTFHITPEGTVLTVGGQTIDYSNPITLSYGTYTLTMTAPGYDTITRTLIVSSATANITLEADVVDEDEDTEETDDSEDDTSTSSSSTSSSGSTSSSSSSSTSSSEDETNSKISAIQSALSALSTSE